VATACVLGDLDLVRPLGRAGIECAAIALPSDPVRHSRFTRTFVDRSGWTTPEAEVDGLLRFASGQDEKPTLFYSNDQDLLLVSRHRDALARAFRFVIAERELIDLIVHKSHAHERFAELDFPVPAVWHLRPAEGPPPEELDFPIVTKPVMREHERAIGGIAKATRYRSAKELRDAWPGLARAGDELLGQRLVEGGEDRIESYHVYVDAQGDTAGEFCGRKLRTFPFEYGNTSALTVTDADDVRDLGRLIVRRLGLRGVAKVDFKRDTEGRLWLLEINPRFNLWHHAGACAGVNIPALVHADLTGTPRPSTGVARAGTTWSDPLVDRLTRADAGLTTPQWLRFQLRCDARWSVAWDDPLPIVRGIAVPFARRRLRGSS
jgi:predicted ATP-grasp superfamily ATP-dependent carboligase